MLFFFIVWCKLEQVEFTQGVLMQYNDEGVIAFLLELHNKTFPLELVQNDAETINTVLMSIFLPPRTEC